MTNKKTPEEELYERIWQTYMLPENYSPHNYCETVVEIVKSERENTLGEVAKILAFEGVLSFSVEKALDELLK